MNEYSLPCVLRNENFNPAKPSQQMLRDAVWFWNKKSECTVLRAKFSLKVIVLILFLPGEKSAMNSSLLLPCSWFW